ncbi:MAG: T9SS type A sorting domain-containing protein [Bacteroidetes bacterium]|nr:T9SS type A sorting domain-containing protein [Bacteroidota bacterium]
MKKTVLSALLICSSWVQAQIVSTIETGEISDGLAIDSEGNIYASDYGGDSVYKYNVSGNFVTTFQSGFSNPNGIGVSPQDEIYICEAGGGTIHKYDTDGNELATFTGLNNPTGIKYDAFNEVFLWVSYNQSALYEFDPANGTSELIHKGLPLFGPSGIAFIDNVPYISNFNDRKIFRLEDDDSLTEISQLPSLGPQNLDFCGFLSAKDGYLIATHLGGHQLFKIDPETGMVISFAGSVAGSDDGSIDSATFNRPNGIVADEVNDIIYVSDALPRNLRIISGITLENETVEEEPNAIVVYLNTFRDTLHLNTKRLTGDYEVSIYAMTGRLIRTTEVSFSENADIEVSINTLSQGTYIVEISNDIATISRKFVK